MAFSRTTSRVEVAREGLAVFRTPMSKGSPMVYGLGFLLGGTSQHLLRGWFLQGTGYEPECAVEGQPVLDRCHANTIPDSSMGPGPRYPTRSIGSAGDVATPIRVRDRDAPRHGSRRMTDLHDFVGPGKHTRVRDRCWPVRNHARRSNHDAGTSRRAKDSHRDERGAARDDREGLCDRGPAR